MLKHLWTNGDRSKGEVIFLPGEFDCTAAPRSRGSCYGRQRNLETPQAGGLEYKEGRVK